MNGTGETSVRDRVRTTALAWLEAVTYAAVLAVTLTVSAVVLGVVTGRGLVGSKYLLFFTGFGLLMYATAKLWPSSPGDLESDVDERAITGTSIPKTPDDTRFQRIVWSLPPLRWLPPPPPGERMSTGGKLFLGGSLVLLVSYAMEAALGIA